MGRTSVLRRARRSRAPAAGQISSFGLVLICDIVEFSTLPQRDQIRTISRLWRWLLARRLTERYGAWINSTGDGALLAFPQQTSISYAGLINLAQSLQSHMRNSPHRRIELRIGVHYGKFQPWSVPGLGEGQYAGKGLNECERVANVGDGGHLVVSEEFVMAWRDDHDDFNYKNFRPSGPNDPLTVLVKHDEPREV